ncbi:mechanosensitive ion channel domain-containing protein [Paracoccaceae bacterium GXU_MW_L88]
MRFFTRIVTIMCLFFYAAPLVAQEGNTGVIAAEEDQAADQQIARRLSDIFGAMEGTDNVQLSVNSGIVTISGQVPDTDLAEQLAAVAGRIEGVVSVNESLDIATSVVERVGEVENRLMARFNQAVLYLPLLLVAGLCFGVIWMIGRWLSGRKGLVSRFAPNPFIANLIQQAIYLAFIAMGLVLALDILGATGVISTVLGAAGIVGLAVGFAVKDSVENYIASIMLSLRQPFGPNDLVDIDGREGHVLLLSSRATVLLDRDGNHVRIPNAQVFKAIITNFTRNPERRFTFDFGVDAAASLSQVQQIGLGALHALPFVLKEPEPKVLVKDLGDSSVLVQFDGWVDQKVTDFNSARSEAVRLTKKAIEAAGIALPEPAYIINISQDGAPIGPRQPKDAAPAPEEADEIADVTPEKDVVQKVEAERAAEAETDLLRADKITLGG